MVSREIKTILFDAYGTLFDISSIDAALEERYGELAREAALLWRRKQLEYTWLRSLMGRYVDFYDLTADALAYTLEACGLESSPADRKALMQEYYRLRAFPEVQAALRRMKGKFHLAILSNANPSLLEHAVTFNGLDELLSDFISADELHLYKPAPAVYRLPEKKLGLAPWNLLFVSSNTWDVAGAAACGLQVAWAKRTPAIPEKLGIRPDTVVKDLLELADMLGC